MQQFYYDKHFLFLNQSTNLIFIQEMTYTVNIILKKKKKFILTTVYSYLLRLLDKFIWARSVKLKFFQRKKNQD